MDKKQKIIDLNEELYNMNIGEMPDDEIEQDIFAELSQTGAFIYSKIKLLEKEDKLEWDTTIVDNSINTLNSLVERRGLEKLKANSILYEYSMLTIEILNLMKELKNE